MGSALVHFQEYWLLREYWGSSFFLSKQFVDCFLRTEAAFAFFLASIDSNWPITLGYFTSISFHSQIICLFVCLFELGLFYFKVVFILRTYAPYTHKLYFSFVLCLDFKILLSWILASLFPWISKSFFSWISNPSLLGWNLNWKLRFNTFERLLSFMN